MAFIWKSPKSDQPEPVRFAIPKNIHFLWGFLGDDGPLHPREHRNHESWQDLNPQWDCRIHSPSSIDSLLQPGPHTDLYRDLPAAIQRCDVARPLLLNQFGGIYSDLDVDPFRDMDWLCGLFPKARVLLIEEVTLSRASSVRRGNRFPIRQGRPELRLRVANFWMASVPGHPFWQDVLDLIHKRRELEIRNDYDVIYTTGPDIISEVYHQTWEKYDDVALVPRRTARRFFRHRTHGSWRMEGKNQRWAA
ncbi:MAG: glycosyltransferase family 32 protein [Pirellulaceae bacterium]